MFTKMFNSVGEEESQYQNAEGRRVSLGSA